MTTWGSVTSQILALRDHLVAEKVTLVVMEATGDFWKPFYEHAMLVTIWNMLQTGTTYNDPGDDFYSRRSPDKTKRRALDQLRSLGYTVTLEPTAEVA